MSDDEQIEHLGKNWRGENVYRLPSSAKRIGPLPKITRYNKFIAASVSALAIGVSSLTGISIFNDPTLQSTLVSAIGAVLVYFVPNAK